MTIYLFKLNDWRMIDDGDGNVDWDADPLAVIVADGAVFVDSYCSQDDMNRVQGQWPDSVHMGVLHLDKGSLDQRCDLATNNPDLWRVLNNWHPFLSTGQS